jgi:hypothetical protein
MNAAAWDALVRDLRNHDDVDASFGAAKRIHREATAADVPRLVELLQDESFFVREAAAWPLSELAGAECLAELLEAYQRGLDEGLDNDGFSAALADLVETDPDAVRPVLEAFVKSGDAALQRNARWLLDFCENRGGT